MPIITQHPLYICNNCNAQADTPKECCGIPMVESPDKFITRSTATPEEIIANEAAQKQAKIDAEAQAVKQANNVIYAQIGDIVKIKEGKLAINPAMDVSEEDQQIADLKLKIQ